MAVEEDLMGLKAMIFVFALWAFSFLIMSPSVVPAWLIDNASLWALTNIIWHIGSAIGFVIAGLKI